MQSYPPVPAAVAEARRFLGHAYEEAGVGEDARETLALLASEVITNAVLHGRSPVTVGLHIGPSTVRIAVSDDDSRRPQLTDLDDRSLGGRGMHLVEALASSWGVQDEALGKTVWFEVAR